MAGHTGESDKEVRLACHDGPGDDGHLTAGNLRPVMKSKQADRALREFFPEPVADYSGGALGDLLGRLEEKDYIAGQLRAARSQKLGRTQKAGGVEVMAAAMHDARALGDHTVIGGLLLLDGVDIGPEGHGGAGTAAPEKTNRTGLHTQINELDAKAGQAPADDVRGAPLLKGQFRMTVKVILDLFQGRGRAPWRW